MYRDSTQSSSSSSAPPSASCTGIWSKHAAAVRLAAPRSGQQDGRTQASAQMRVTSASCCAATTLASLRLSACAPHSASDRYRSASDPAAQPAKPPSSP